MLKRRLASLTFVSFAGLVATASCSSSSSSGGTPGTDAGSPDSTSGDGPVGGNFMLTVPCTDSADSLYANPGTLPGDKGAIIRCHQDADISLSDLQATASASDPDAGEVGYSGKPFTSGAHVYRILYRTERGNSAKTPGYSVALVYVPTVPRAAALPTVLAVHGSRGQAAHCAPTLNDPAGSYVEADFIHLVYPLVGSGYFVVAPDLAGYSNYGAANNPPSGYAVAQDGANSALDSVRAAQKMFAGSLKTDVVIAAHSIGGETGLATFALYPQYAPELNVTAVVAYSPEWLPRRAYAAIFLDTHDYPVATGPAPEVAFWYFYTKGALELGVDHALDVFVNDPAKRAAIKSFVDNDCWSATYPDLAAHFSIANDAFDPTFVGDIGPAAGPMDAGCGTDMLCQQWMNYFATERPHITGAAKQVPILYLYGGQDTTIPPSLSTCGHDRLVADGANIVDCFEPMANHVTIVATKADYVADWIASKTLGGAAPAACTSGWPSGDAGASFVCNPLIVNNED